MNRRNNQPEARQEQAANIAYPAPLSSQTRPTYEPPAPSEEVGPNMTVAQENEFANRTLLLISVIPALSILAVTYGLDYLFDNNIERGCKNADNKDANEAANAFATYGYLLFLGVLVGLMAMPKRMLKANMVAVVAYIMLLVGFISLAFWANNAYRNGVIEPEELKKKAVLVKKTNTKEGKPEDPCLTYRSALNSHIFFSFLALSGSVFANSIIVNFGIMNFYTLAAPVITGLTATVLVAQDFADANTLNTAIGIMATLLPFFFILRLQMWISGKAPCQFKPSQTIGAAVALFGEIPQTVIDAMGN